MRPIILAVDDDPAVAQAVARDLRERYAADYQIVRTASGTEALEVLGELALGDQPVALIVSDHRMPEMTGVEFLQQARPRVPDAKLVLLTAYADTDAAISAINDVGLDRYLMKPWAPPEEHLYPVLDDLLDDWVRSNGARYEGVRVVGNRWSDRAVQARLFLARNHVPYQWLEVERSAEGARLSEQLGGELPLVVLPDGTVLHDPSTRTLADALGIRTETSAELYDLVVIGAGPSGLAAAVYGASEGLRTAVIERDAPGGQAGQSSRIENYLGFPNGLSGSDLSARAHAQAVRLGAELVLTREVVSIEQRGNIHAVVLEDGSVVETRTVVLATGVSYRFLEADGLEELIGRGVFYGASASEARHTEGDDVYVVGAANSAGQAALHFARFARSVVMVVRGDDLGKSMSQYLVSRIESTPNIEVRYETEVVGGGGSEHLERITLRDASGALDEVEASWLYVFIGASPRTDWLPASIARDERGFILTGAEIPSSGSGGTWPLTRPPALLETSVPGIFATGDVRLGSMKRVASAVGEGSTAISLVHLHLEST